MGRFEQRGAAIEPWSAFPLGMDLGLQDFVKCHAYSKSSRRYDQRGCGGYCLEFFGARARDSAQFLSLSLKRSSATVS
jgi:hypothetical protein